MKQLLHILVLVALLASVAMSATIRVPADIERIQTAIETVQPGDTILIADGLYRERLNFNGKNIVVCGNIVNPEQVVIKPADAGSVVVFENGEGAEAVLCGVTLRGAISDFGGGVYVKDASPTLHHLVVDSCTVSSSGGGFSLTNRRKFFYRIS